MNQWDWLKLKNFCTTKENSHQIQGTAHRIGEKSLPATHPVKD
jgi:hypothetical protein